MLNRIKMNNETLIRSVLSVILCYNKNGLERESYDTVFYLEEFIDSKYFDLNKFWKSVMESLKRTVHLNIVVLF
mgnify:CR=1 FL=1